METALVQFDVARAALEKASSIDEVKAVRDQAEALRLYYRQSTQGLEMQNQCAAIKLRAERRAGEMLAVMEKNKGAATQSHPVTAPPATLAELGIGKMQSSRWQKVADIPEEAFEEHISQALDADDEELTTAGMLRLVDKPHVARASGENEWYTPRDYIEAARNVMTVIDLDPASTEEADAVVGARRFYTIKDDGLSMQWEGRVWLNPPYASDLVGRFADKLIQEYTSRHVTTAIVLVNNATETAWFQKLATNAVAICFPQKRIKFWGPGGDIGAPLQGQAVLYFGQSEADFISEFRTFGLVVIPVFISE